MLSSELLKVLSQQYTNAPLMKILIQYRQIYENLT